METKYYKMSKGLKISTIACWIFLVLNASLFLIQVFDGNWSAFISYGVVILFILILWNHYKIFLPKMESSAKHLFELKNRLNKGI